MRLFIFICFGPLNLYGQQFRLVIDTQFYILDLPCNYSIKDCNQADDLWDFAYHPDGRYITTRNERDSITFFEFDTLTCSRVRLGAYVNSNLALPKYFYYIDYLGRIYLFASDQKSRMNTLYRMSDFNGSGIDTLLNFPFNSKYIISDLTIIKDSVYVLNAVSQEIYHCDTNFQIKWISKTSVPIRSFSVIKIDCDSSLVVCVGINYPVQQYRDSLASIYSDSLFLFTYDFVTDNILDSICIIKVGDLTWTGHISSKEEFLASDPECDLLIDLDRDNSSGLYPYDFNAHQNICNTGMIPICDGDVYIHTSFYMDSMRFVVRGILDVGMEQLILLNGPPGYSLQQQTDSSYVLKPGPDRSDASYVMALKNIFYQNTNPIGQSGARQIRMQGYNVVKSGVWVNSYLKLGHKPNSGQDSSLIVCDGTIVADASKFLRGAESKGIWEPMFQSGSNLLDLSKDAEGIYQYITHDAYCGSDTAQLSIRRGLGVELELGPDQYLCKGDSLWIEVQDSLLQRVEWSDGQNNNQRYLQAPGLYKIKTYSTDGCENTDSIELKLSGQLIKQTKRDSVCPNVDYLYKGNNFRGGQTILDTIQSVIGCDSLLEIQLLKRTNPQKQTQLQVCEGKTINYKGIDYHAGDTATLLISSSQTCDTIEAIHVEKLKKPLVIVTGDTILCIGQKTILQSNVSKAYKWSTGSSTQKIEIQDTGIYSLTITDENQCENNLKVHVKQAPQLKYEINSNQPICSGQDNGTIEIKNKLSSPGIVKYELNTQLQLNGMYRGLYAGMYYLKLTDENGCEYTDTVKLRDPAIWSVNLPTNIQLEKGENRQIQIKVDSIKIKAIIFDPDQGIKKLNDSVYLITGDQNINYQIKVIDENGCEKEYQLQIEVIDNTQVYMPNSFSPNGDGINEWYFPKSRESKQLIRFEIYDRWGNRVYSQSNMTTNDETTGWNGRINNQPAAVGVYVCYMEWHNPDGSIVKKTYDLTLVR
ncbi:MAG: gliding motility-associated C-terminal domain-containing protein [Saprospiraceae bacterium]